MIARPHSERMRRVQDRRLIALVAHAYNRVPLYRRRFDEAGVHPRQIWGVDDLPLLPPLDRQEVAKAPLDEVLARGADPSKLAQLCTSGSTGIAVTAYLGQRELDRRTLCSRYRSRAIPGCRPWARRMDVAGPRPVRWWQSPARRFTDARLDSRLPIDEIVARIRKYRPRILGARPSAWLQICQEVERTTGPMRLAEVYRSGADMLFPHIEREIERVLLQAPTQYYGSRELGSIGLECRPRSGYHIYADRLVVETVPTNSAEPGGEILITALRQKAMPLIRYRIGDYGVLSQERCSCGSPFPILKELLGRTNDVVETRNGRTVAGYEFYHGFQVLDYIDRFQFVQRRRGELEARIQPNDRFDSACEREVLELLRSLTHDDMDITLTCTDSFPPPHAAKFKVVVRETPS